MGTRRLCALWAITAAWFGPPVFAQSLDEQYEFYLQTLGDRCENMEFARTLPDRDMLPGQAGPNLFALCSGAPLLGGPPGSTQGVNSGSAGATAGRGFVDNSALRRRRERRRADQDEQAWRSSAPLYGAAGADSDAAFGAAGVFASLDYRSEQQDSTFYEGGSDADRFQLTAGVDYRFAAALLGGAALRVGTVSGKFDSGGDFDVRNYGVAVYGSWTPIDALFVDLNAGFDYKQQETARLLSRQTTTPTAGPPIVSYLVLPSTAFGETDIQVINADLLIGYDIAIGAVTLGPRAGMSLLDTRVDAYVETGATPMSLAFDEQDYDSLQATVGLQASIALNVSGTVIVPQFNANWLHEYRNDQRRIDVRFAEDIRAAPVRFSFLNQPPDRDVYTARLGAVAVFQGGLSAFVAFEKLFAHDYRDQFGASVGVRWEL